MSDRWDADPFPASESYDVGSSTCLADPSLSDATIVRTPSSLNGTITYGLAAKVALSRPGYNCRVEHDLPMGVEFVEARPRATVVGDHLIWQIARLDPGQELSLVVVVRPEADAELRPDELAAFTMTYSQNLFLEAPIARPRLAARFSGPEESELGEHVDFILDVVNSGNWTVDHVRVKLVFPSQYSYSTGPDVELKLGTVPAGESVRITLPVVASSPGSARITATITGSPDREATVEFVSDVHAATDEK